MKTMKKRSFVQLFLVSFFICNFNIVLAMQHPTSDNSENQSNVEYNLKEEAPLQCPSCNKQSTNEGSQQESYYDVASFYNKNAAFFAYSNSLFFTDKVNYDVKVVKKSSL